MPIGRLHSIGTRGGNTVVRSEDQNRSWRKSDLVIFIRGGDKAEIDGYYA